MILRYAYLLLGFFQAELLFPGGRYVLAFDSCLSQLVSLCVWLLPLNFCKLAFRLSLTHSLVQTWPQPGVQEVI